MLQLSSRDRGTKRLESAVLTLAGVVLVVFLLAGVLW